jgi:hypothetical protein
VRYYVEAIDANGVWVLEDVFDDLETAREVRDAIRASGAAARVLDMGVVGGPEVE